MGTYNPWPKTQSQTVAGAAGRSQDSEVQGTKQRKYRPPKRGTIVKVFKKGGVTSLPHVKINDSKIDGLFIQRWLLLHDS